MHASEPSGAYLPAGHACGVPAGFSQLEPPGQGVQSASPAAEYEPGGQTASTGASVEKQRYPAGQSVQLACPATEYVPIGQAVPRAPEEHEKPAGHCRHLEESGEM